MSVSTCKQQPLSAPPPAAPRLSLALRNPTVLAAADAVLRGGPAQAVDFGLTVPVERQLRARVARIDRPSIDGAVAVLTLNDITELKKAEQMRADFIANASHELRTPLATLIGFIETLRGPARGDAEARERFLAIMQDQASRMTRLVEDLLSLSRIELNEHVMPKDRVDLRPLLHRVVEALELRASERGIRIGLALPTVLPEVLGADDELAQVFQNLLDNAIKYGRPGRNHDRRRDGSRPTGGDRGSSAIMVDSSARPGRGHRPRAPAAADRTLLSGRHRALARDGRHRARAWRSSSTSSITTAAISKSRAPSAWLGIPSAVAHAEPGSGSTS